MSSNTFILTAALLKLKKTPYFFQLCRQGKAKGFTEILTPATACEEPGPTWHSLWPVSSGAPELILPWCLEVPVSAMLRVDKEPLELALEI